MNPYINPYGPARYFLPFTVLKLDILPDPDTRNAVPARYFLPFTVLKPIFWWNSDGTNCVSPRVTSYRLRFWNVQAFSSTQVLQRLPARYFLPFTVLKHRYLKNIKCFAFVNPRVTSYRLRFWNYYQKNIRFLDDVARALLLTVYGFETSRDLLAFESHFGVPPRVTSYRLRFWNLRVHQQPHQSLLHPRVTSYRFS